MAKALKLEQLDTSVEKIVEMIASRELHFGEVVDASTTQEHANVEKIATKLETIASNLRQSEKDFASQEVDSLGSDLANVVSDKDQLAKLLSLAKSGRLNDIINSTN